MLVAFGGFITVSVFVSWQTVRILCDANNQHNTCLHYLYWSLYLNQINWQNNYFYYHVLTLAFIRNNSDHWSMRSLTAAEFWNMMLTELSLKWCWKVFSLVHCLQAAESLRQNLLNKESLVLHKGLEMWAMDSASLYSGESIITEDATQDREKRQREKGRKRWMQTRDAVKRERGRQWAEKRCWCFQCWRFAFAILS